LAIFDGLVRQFPGNPDIENGRTQCLAALKRPDETLALEDRSTMKYADGELDEPTVRRVILEKMLRGRSEMAQLQAAELACKLLGLFSEKGSEAPPHDGAEEESTSDTGDDGQDSVAEVEDEDSPVDSSFEAKRKSGSGGIFEL
jgi:hypothetical protein